MRGFYFPGFSHPATVGTQQQGNYGGMMGGGYGNGYGGMMGGSYPGGMMGGTYGKGYGGMMTTLGQSISIQQAIQLMQTIPSYAKANSSSNSIAFSSQDISIPVLAIMPDRAINLTGMQPPTYSHDDVFVIYGLINPTLFIPAGATVHFSIVNLDDDMYHNIAVSSISPPYPYMSMQGMMSSYWSSGRSGSTTFPVMSMMPFLPPADYNQGLAHEYSYSLTFSQAGTFWYLCTYPGHAQSGMYGQLVVAS